MRRKDPTSRPPEAIDATAEKIEVDEEGWLQAEFAVLAAQAKALSASVVATTGIIEWRCKKLMRGYDGRD